MPLYLVIVSSSDLLGLMPCGRHQRVVVVERDHRQDDVLGERVRRADERLAAAGALEAVQPHDRRARLGFHRFGDLLRPCIAKSQRRGGETAELEEAATRDALPAHQVIVGIDHDQSSGSGVASVAAANCRGSTLPPSCSFRTCPEHGGLMPVNIVIRRTGHYSKRGASTPGIRGCNGWRNTRIRRSPAKLRSALGSGRRSRCREEYG